MAEFVVVDFSEANPKLAYFAVDFPAECAAFSVGFARNVVFGFPSFASSLE